MLKKMYYSGTLQTYPLHIRYGTLLQINSRINGPLLKFRIPCMKLPLAPKPLSRFSVNHFCFEWCEFCNLKKRHLINIILEPETMI